MYYAKQINENGEIVALHTMDRPFIQTVEFIPITEAEYESLLSEFTEKIDVET